jgi:hypothetical protein
MTSRGQGFDQCRGGAWRAGTPPRRITALPNQLLLSTRVEVRQPPPAGNRAAADVHDVDARKDALPEYETIVRATHVTQGNV